MCSIFDEEELENLATGGRDPASDPFDTPARLADFPFLALGLKDTPEAHRRLVNVIKTLNRRIEEFDRAHPSRRPGDFADEGSDLRQVRNGAIYGLAHAKSYDPRKLMGMFPDGSHGQWVVTVKWIEAKRMDVLDLIAAYYTRIADRKGEYGPQHIYSYLKSTGYDISCLPPPAWTPTQGDSSGGITDADESDLRNRSQNE